jgi:endoglucanase
VNNGSLPDTWRNRWEAYYPGDHYVDWVGVSGYNWGRASSFGRWRSFENLDRSVLAYLKSKYKPVMITEIASVEKGGDKPAWLTDMFRRIRTAHPEVRAVIYYDARQSQDGSTQDWRINSTTRSLTAYRAAIHSSYYVGRAPAALAKWRTLLARSLKVR